MHKFLSLDDYKVNIFGFHFSGVYTLESKEFKELPPRGLAVSCEEVAFNEEAILDKLNNLKVNKFPGPDSVFYTRLDVKL